MVSTPWQCRGGGGGSVLRRAFRRRDANRLGSGGIDGALARWCVDSPPTGFLGGGAHAGHFGRVDSTALRAHPRAAPSFSVAWPHRGPSARSARDRSSLSRSSRRSRRRSTTKAIAARREPLVAVGRWSLTLVATRPCGSPPVRGAASAVDARRRRRARCSAWRRGRAGSCRRGCLARWRGSGRRSPSRPTPRVQAA